MDYVHHALVKPLIAGGLAYAGNSIFLGEANMRRNVSFAMTVFGSLVIADTVITYAMPKTDFKTLEGRVLEVTASLGSVYVLDTVMGNNISPATRMNRYGVVIGSEILADYIKSMVLNTGV